MPNILTVTALANSWADRTLAHQDLPEAERAVLHRRAAYDFKVTGFNVSTIALVVTAALAIFTGAPFILILTALTYYTRQAFHKDLKATVPLREAGIQARTAALLEHFGLVGAREGWQHKEFVILNFTAWENWLPQPAPQAVVQG